MDLALHQKAYHTLKRKAPALGIKWGSLEVVLFRSLSAYHTLQHAPAPISIRLCFPSQSPFADVTGVFKPSSRKGARDGMLRLSFEPCSALSYPPHHFAKPGLQSRAAFCPIIYKMKVEVGERATYLRLDPAPAAVAILVIGHNSMLRSSLRSSPSHILRWLLAVPRFGHCSIRTKLS